MNRGLDRDLFSVDVNKFFAVNKTTAEGTFALETNDKDVSLGLSEILLQVMEDAAGIAHPRAGENGAGSFELIEFFRVLRGDARDKPFGSKWSHAARLQVQNFFLVEVRVLEENLCGLNGHRAVQIDRKWPDALLMEQ